MKLYPDAPQPGGANTSGGSPDHPPRLEELNAAIRGQHLSSEELSDSAAAVWQRLGRQWAETTAAGAVPLAAAASPSPAAPGLLQGCADMRSLAPAYRRSELSPDLRLLLEDHLAHCVGCRDAFAGRPAPAARLAVPFPPAAARHPYRWAAAALAVAAAIAVAIIYVRVSPASGQAVVLAAAGPVYELGSSGPAPVRAHWLAFGPRYRNTAQTELRLPDGSRLDLRAHSEFALAGGPRGAQLHLIAGDVIIEAAHQSRGRQLQVRSPGAVVTSLGTIFAVQQGLKGARIAVLRGSVRVNYQGRQAVVAAGGQLATNPSLQAAPLAASFAWSTQSGKYLQLAASLAKLRSALAQVPPPALRYSSGLAQLLPANTVFFASLPNLQGQLAASFQILQTHLAQDPVLRQWWRKKNPNAGNLETTVRPFLQLGADLGPEIVIAAGLGRNGQPSDPMLLARVTNAGDFARRLALLPLPPGSHGQRGPRPRLIQTSRLPARLTGPVVWLHNGLLAAALDGAPLRALQQRLNGAAYVPFTATPFYSHVAQTYAAGVSVLVAANLHALLANPAITAKNPGLAQWPAQLGISNANTFIAASRETSGLTTNRAVLAFSSPRRGVAAWLAPPQPMQALSYISPDPHSVFAITTIQPAALAAQIQQLQIAGTASPGSAAAPPEWLLNLLDPLTGEFAAALDGPMLPSPNWIVVAGINDPAAFQSSLASALAAIGGGAITPITVNGQDAYRLALPFGFTAVYMYTGGDLIAASSSAWLTQALRFHSSGYNLLHSQRFLQSLPLDDQLNCSALVYQNLGSAVGQLLGFAGNAGMTAQQRQGLAGLASQAPTTVCAYAEPERISVAMNGTVGPLGFLEHSLFGVRNLPIGPLKALRMAPHAPDQRP